MAKRFPGMVALVVMTICAMASGSPLDADIASPQPTASIAHALSRDALVPYWNDWYGFGLEYPASWHLEERDWRDSTSPPNVARYSVRLTAPDGEAISISVWDNPSGLALMDWFEEHQKPLLTEVDAIPSGANAKVAGTDAVFIADRQAPGVPASLATLLLWKSWVLRAEYIAQNDGSSLAVYTRILSSLEFGPTSTVDHIPAVSASTVMKPTTVLPHDPDCCQRLGLVDPNGNPYDCGEDGNCVWYANYIRPDFQALNLGSGYQWDETISDDDDLRERFTISQDPEIGAIAVFERDFGYDVNITYGHVAYVVDVSGDNFKVKQMSWGDGLCEVSTEDYANSSRVQFIRAGVTLFEDPNYNGDWIRLRASASDLYSVPFDTDPSNMVGDKASAIYVPPAWDSYSFRHHNYEGGYLGLYDRREGDLSGLSFSDASPANDNISSVQVGQYMCLLPPSSVVQLGEAGSSSGAEASSCMPRPDPDPRPIASDSATFISHVTLPGDTIVSPGQALHKVWRVRNSGTSTWGGGYQLVFTGGDQMSGPSAVSVPGTVSPGATIDLAVDMTAPSNEGSYVGHWRLRNGQGVYFGDELYVDIGVQGDTQDGDITVSSVSYPTVVEPGESFRPEIRVRVNSGVLSESRGDLLRNTDGNLYGAWPHVAVVGSVYAQQEYTFHFYEDDPITAPSMRGTYESHWRVWQDGHYAGPEVLIRFEVQPPESLNRPPHPPTQVRPGDWHVSWDGQAPELCASHNGDPDNDPVTAYYFDVFGPQTWNSGWIAATCATPAGLGYHTYGWRVKVRDDRGAESGWSDEWRFTLVDQEVTIPVMYFDPVSPSAADDVHLFAESEGCGDMVTMRASANTADDGTDSGEWVIFYELGLSHIEPMWSTRSFSNGTHLVRVEARGCEADWEHSAVRIEPYTLLHRRPAEPLLIAPMDGEYVSSRSVTFLWEEAIRADSYHLQVSTSPDPGQSPIVDVILSSDTTSYLHEFGDDLEALYWRVGASNDMGTSHSPSVWHFGIDRTPPTTSVVPLPSVGFEPHVSVSWQGNDTPASIRHYDVQYRDGERGDWQDWMVGTESTLALFLGQPGHTYYFRSRGVDNAQNQEPYPSVADTHILIDPTQRPPAPWWDPSYGVKRNVTLVNNDSRTMWAGHPVGLHFDDGTTPTAAQLHTASLSAIPGDDLRIVYNDETELDRYVQRFTATKIDIWFNTQVDIPGLGTDSDSHQLYYGSASATTPPGEINDVFAPGTDANTVGLWHLQEGSGGTVYDSSGRGHHGTLHNGVWMASGLGLSVDFDGESAHIEVAGHPDFDLQRFTLEAWIWYPASVGANKIIYRPTNLPDQAATYGMETSGSKIRVEGCSGPLESHGGPSFGQWAHVAGTYDGSKVRVYLNGRLDAERDCTGALRTSDRVVGIGFNPNTTVQHFYGRMQHVRISNIARTSFPYAEQRPLDLAPSTAAGAEIEQPGVGAANLAVQSISSYPSSVGGLVVQAVVHNAGDASTTNGFYADLYADHEPTGPGDLAGSVRFWIASPIDAGATVSLTTVLSDVSDAVGLSAAPSQPLSETPVTLYAQADSEGVILEPDEEDNISSGLEVCIASPDVYEDDEEAGDAQPIALGATQHHNMDSRGDQDWVAFDAHGGVTYSIETSNLGTAADTYVYLYDTDGCTLLAANDDFRGTLASHIAWQAPANGTYYVMARHWNPNAGGCGTAYDLSVALHGDFDLDCELTVADIMVVASRWGCGCGGGCYDERYDMDGDCDVDVVDVMTVAARWGCQCGDASCAAGLSASGHPEAILQTAQPVLRLEPSTSIVAPGESLAVAVKVEDASDLGGFQFALHFDPAVVQVEDMSLGDFLASTGRTTTPLGPEIDNAAGIATFGGFSFGDQAGTRGDGMLVEIRMMAKETGASMLTLENAQIVDAVGRAQRVTLDSASVTVGFGQRTYLPLIVE